MMTCQWPQLDAQLPADLVRNGLSISGLHMAVVGGFAFFLVRLLVAAWPWLALRVSGKKVAAWAGLGAVATYLVISGSPAPAERAAITASIAACWSGVVSKPKASAKASRSCCLKSKRWPGRAARWA